MTKSYDRYITCPKHFFHSRCIERGYSPSDNYECIIKEDKDQYTIDTHHPSYPSTSKRESQLENNKQSQGVGTELKKLLKMVGITASPGCSCNKRAAKMDNLGIQWCKDNVNEIVSWLREEASKRRLPFADFIGKRIVKIAISRAESN